MVTGGREWKGRKGGRDGEGNLGETKGREERGGEEMEGTTASIGK